MSSVNAHQEFTNFRYDNNRLSLKEEAKFEWDGRELGWFITDRPHDFKTNLLKPNWHLTVYTRKIIQAKLHARNYARSNVCGAKLLAEEFAKSATEHERHMSDIMIIKQYRNGYFGLTIILLMGCPKSGSQS